MMKTIDLTSKWEAFQADKGYVQRLDQTHPLDFFIGIDAEGHDELVLFSVPEPVKLQSSKELKVEKHPRRTDGKWATQISSLNADNREIFARLCVDLVDSSYDVKTEREGLERVTKRFLAWQKLFAAMKTTLSNSVIKGMIGELLFARDKVEPLLGWEKTLDAWQGPEGADRDYLINDTWCEVKAISTGKNNVTISSLNQLEVENDGYLSVYYVDASSSTDAAAFSVSGFVNSFKEMLKEYPVALQKFEQKMISIGYINKSQYDDIYFKCNGVAYYKVTKDFPRLVTSSVPEGIIGASYDIDLTCISKWKVDDGQLWN